MSFGSVRPELVAVTRNDKPPVLPSLCSGMVNPNYGYPLPEHYKIGLATLQGSRRKASAGTASSVSVCLMKTGGTGRTCEAFCLEAAT